MNTKLPAWIVKREGFSDCLEYLTPQGFFVEYPELAEQFLSLDKAYAAHNKVREYYSSDEQFICKHGKTQLYDVQVVQTIYRTYDLCIPNFEKIVEKIKQHKISEQYEYFREEFKIFGYASCLNDSYLNCYFNFIHQCQHDRCFIVLQDNDDAVFVKDVQTIEEGLEVIEELVTRAPIFLWNDLDLTWEH